MTEQLTKEQAREFHEARKWSDMTDKERAVFQLKQELLCMPFGVFHASVAKALGRDLYEIELAYNAENILNEIESHD